MPISPIPGAWSLRRACRSGSPTTTATWQRSTAAPAQIQTSAVTGSNDVGIAIPASAAGVPANPTGQVYNGTGGFLIPTSNGQETALFIFDGEGGTIAAWAKDSGATAVTAYDDGVVNGTEHAVYKGLALGSVNGASFLYATDLHNDKVDVFDTNFAKPAAMQGKFIDPTMPAGLCSVRHRGVEGPVVRHLRHAGCARCMTKSRVPAWVTSTYSISTATSSAALHRRASLNAPWGIALAPAGFGALEGDLLIGNFGDGTINIFAPNGTSWRPRWAHYGQQRPDAGDPGSVVPGLWRRRL